MKPAKINELHQKLIIKWTKITRKGKQIRTRKNGTLESWIIYNHLCNFTIWGLEDEVRRIDIDPEQIIYLKAQINTWNQRRNDAIAEIDKKYLEILPNGGAPLHTESLGMIIDRMSIIHLKIYNLNQLIEVNKKGIGEGYNIRLSKIKEQLADLNRATNLFYNELISGKKTFKVYVVGKIYNDQKIKDCLAELRQKHENAQN